MLGTCNDTQGLVGDHGLDRGGWHRWVQRMARLATRPFDGRSSVKAILKTSRELRKWRDPALFDDLPADITD